MNFVETYFILDIARRFSYIGNYKAQMGHAKMHPEEKNYTSLIQAENKI
jgi:hypothetical protein